ncbi:MAG: RNA-binding S4 domain-containing protein [Oscillospiraceae bacterium]|nr:RNA-binding S4 domain-containing protein [Oscillospiraceae bacterium]
MRLDKFLKTSRIIKRRTVAKGACDKDNVYVNGKMSKPSTIVQEGDIIEIKFANSALKVRVLDIKIGAKKEDALSLYEIIE